MTANEGRASGASTIHDSDAHPERRRFGAGIQVRTRVLLLLSACLALFLSGLAVQQHLQETRRQDLLEHAAEQRRDFLAKIVTLKSDLTDRGASDYTFWDDMVTFAERPDSSFARENLEPFLENYLASHLWIHDVEGRLIYSIRADGVPPEPGAMPGADEALRLLRTGKRSCRFFTGMDAELFEVFGYTIHPTTDPARRTAPRGYFFTARRWDESLLAEIARLAGAPAEREWLSGPSGGSRAAAARGEHDVYQDLPGWDLRPVARLHLRSSSTLLRASERASSQDIFFTAIFSVLVVALMYVTLTRWVRDPLGRLVESLNRETAEPVLRLAGERNEFGRLALLLARFFEQRDTLEREVRERSAAEREVRTLNAELERRVAERTRELQIEVEEKKSAEAAALRAKETAEKASHAKSEFLAVMSHELRTPLTVIIGVAEILEDAELDDRQRHLLSTLSKSAHALLVLIQEVLDLTGAAAGKLKLEPADFDLVSAVDEAVEGLAIEGRKKGLQVRCRIEPGVPERVRGDRRRLLQVLLNLVRNAVKFTEEGRVDVRVSRRSVAGEGCRLLFEVIDTGPGIPLEAQATLFQMFSQVDASPTRQHAGAGLGLAISKSLVELMGGEIGVESGEGRGSRFWFTVKLDGAAGDAERETASQREAA